MCRFKKCFTGHWPFQIHHGSFIDLPLLEFNRQPLVVRGIHRNDDLNKFISHMTEEEAFDHGLFVLASVSWSGQPGFLTIN